MIAPARVGVRKVGDVGASHKRRPAYVLGVASVGLGLIGTLLMAIIASPAFASISGTFVPVTAPNVCTLASGFSSTGSSCGPGIAGQDYIYLPTSGSNLTYSFTLPSGTSEMLTYGIPAGGFLNNVAGTISLDGGAPITVNSNLGGFNQTTPTDLALWTSPLIGPGAHTLTITSTGDSVNIYGLWISGVVQSVTVPCGTGTTSCSATVSAPSQTVATTGSKPSSTTATITLSVDTEVLSCANFSYLAPVATLNDSGLENGTNVSVTDTVAGLPSKKGVLVCYQPSGPSPPAPVFLKKCHGHKPAVPCYKSITEVGGSVVVNLLLPAGDPRFHIGGAAPIVTSVKPTTPKAGKKVTIKGENLSEVTRVTIGGVTARILKASPSSIHVIAPAGAHGGVLVSSLAGVAQSAVVVAVS
jgi:hypothetical protein